MLSAAGMSFGKLLNQAGKTWIYIRGYVLHGRDSTSHGLQFEHCPLPLLTQLKTAFKTSHSSSPLLTGVNSGHKKTGTQRSGFLEKKFGDYLLSHNL